MIRIGHGYDVHAFGPGDHVVLGGVRIDFDRALVAHSDGDVVVHALADAMLGAIAEGDIGRHFPDDDQRWADADSRTLLREIVAIVHDRGYELSNADITVIAEQPKLKPYIRKMRESLSEDLQAAASQVSVKATTSEGLGFAGRGEGIAVHAVVLLMVR